MTPVTFIPDHAPFTPEQRAWLNGFFAGIFGVAGDQNPVAMTTASSTATMPPQAMRTAEPPSPAAPLSVNLSTEAPAQLAASTPQVAEEVDDNDFPWHDPALDMEERLAMAKDRPLKRQLMAAMAQLDCGSCGYDCKRYSEALARGVETSTDLCVPGGFETEEQLERLLAANRALPVVTAPKPTPVPVQPVTVDPVAAPTVQPAMSPVEFDRKNPIQAKFLFARPLNQPGSQKDTRHVAVEFRSIVPAYRCGDALGVYPINDPSLVRQIIIASRLNSEEIVTTHGGTRKMLFSALSEDYCLRSGSDAFSGARNVDRDGDLLDVIEASAMDWETAQEFVDRLRPLQPRLYSISSSPRKYPNQIHLTIARVEYERNERRRLGVASTMFADRLEPNQSLRVFLHRPSAFSLPQNPDAAMIMVGPGTGIAPFIAFLQDREASGAQGKNWLFFGDQHVATDFLYETQLKEWQQSGVLHRLDTAFSRDQEAKIYVQDRMLQHGEKIFQWLRDGAYFYVCGDAKSMAASVQNALQQIIAMHGNLSPAAALEHVKVLQKQQRIQRDVY